MSTTDATAPKESNSVTGNQLSEERRLSSLERDRYTGGAEIYRIDATMSLFEIDTVWRKLS